MNLIMAQEQAGFRSDRDTIDQIFDLRIILEETREANITLHTV